MLRRAGWCAAGGWLAAASGLTGPSATGHDCFRLRNTDGASDFIWLTVSPACRAAVPGIGMRIRLRGMGAGSFADQRQVAPWEHPIRMWQFCG
jgi:hypothetical protein